MKYGIYINESIDAENNCNADIFNNLILFLDTSIDTDDEIRNYKKMHLNAMKALLVAGDKIKIGRAHV